LKIETETAIFKNVTKLDDPFVAKLKNQPQRQQFDQMGNFLIQNFEKNTYFFSMILINRST